MATAKKPETEIEVAETPVAPKIKIDVQITMVDGKKKKYSAAIKNPHGCIMKSKMNPDLVMQTLSEGMVSKYGMRHVKIGG